MTGCCCYFIFLYSRTPFECVCAVWYDFYVYVSVRLCAFACSSFDCYQNVARIHFHFLVLYLVHSVIRFDRFHPKFDSLHFPYGFPSVSSRNVHMTLMQYRSLYLCMCVLAFLMQKITDTISNWVESRILPKNILLCENYTIMISMCDGTNWRIKNIPFVLSNGTRYGAYRLKYVVLSSVDD